jgi:septation ring formation regulator EzrA
MGVTKQKKPLRRMKAEPTSADFTVVLEDLRSNFAVFGEALQVVREEMGQRFEQVDRRFEQIDRRFEQIDRRFEQVDYRFEQVDYRFDQIDRRFDRAEGELGGLTTDMTLVKSAVIELARANKGRVGG